jgi:hypothetical protein
MKIKKGQAPKLKWKNQPKNQKGRRKNQKGPVPALISKQEPALL